MKTQEENNKIQVGMICHFERDKKGHILPETTITEPIYEDWTPELQVAQDRMFDNFAKAIYQQIKEYERKGIDISKLGTPEVNQQIKDIHQAEQKQREKEAQLRKLKRNMTDEELEEFLKWKESKKKND